MSKIDLFNNLVLLAAADKRFAEEEVAYLAEKSVQWGITEDEVNAALVGAASSESEIVLPESTEDRKELLKEMIHLMAIDGELAEVEKKICATAAAAMEIDGVEFDRLLSQLLDELR